MSDDVKLFRYVHRGAKMDKDKFGQTPVAEGKFEDAGGIFALHYDGRCSVTVRRIRLVGTGKTGYVHLISGDGYISSGSLENSVGLSLDDALRKLKERRIDVDKGVNDETKNE